MRVLVTGGSGFIGRHCIPFLLRAGYEVHMVSRTPLDIAEVTWHSVDLLSPNAPSRIVSIVKPEAVLHLAWCTTPGEYWSSSENVEWVQASIDLFYASSLSGCRRIVVAGTSAEYDWSTGVCSESLTPLRPASLYGRCKGSAYSGLRKLASQQGINWSWGRIFNVYGPHEHPKRLVPSILRSILSPDKSEILVPDERRDFLHVSDTASALVMLLASDVHGAVNIGSGNSVTICDLARRVGRAVGESPRVVVQATRSEAPLVEAENEILRSKVGWKPLYSLETGIDETVAWWQRQSVS